MLNVSRVALGAICAIGLCAGVASAGDLTPPVGPVTETMKPLNDIEPRIAINATNTPGDADSVFRITAGGSYYLTDNVIAGAGEHGVQIAASDVTLDLNGFYIRGNLGTSLYGVHAEGTLFSVEIRNGFVFAFNDGGIGGTYIRPRVLNMRVTNTNGIGISLGSRATVSGCSVDANVLGGISAGSSARVSDCVVTNSTGGPGINIGDGSVVNDCVANANQAGIVAAARCNVISCTASTNTGNGIDTGRSSAVRDSDASNNTGHGFEIGQYGQVTNCSANENTLSGIRSLSRGRVEGCTINNNKQHGVHITFAGSIENCFLNGNDVNAIEMDNGGVVTIRNNTISESVIGIDLSVGGGCRLEGNAITVCSSTGIRVTSFGNLVIGNYCSGIPTDYNVVGGNLFGPLVTSGTIAGNTNPHANYRD